MFVFPRVDPNVCFLSDILNNPEADKPHPSIEDLIARKERLSKALRLICLQSHACDGLKPKTLDLYKRDIVQVMEKY